MPVRWRPFPRPQSGNVSVRCTTHARNLSDPNAFRSCRRLRFFATRPSSRAFAVSARLANARAVGSDPSARYSGRESSSDYGRYRRLPVCPTTDSWRRDNCPRHLFALGK
jgi:hypothetical protein